MTTIEEEIQSKGLTAPRITPTDVENAIAGEYVGRASDIFSGTPVLPSMECLTICVLVLKNGFTVVGKSACASPANFDAALGARIARDDAKAQIWPLMGYALRDKLAG